jgi:hypothetical protein
LNGRGQKAVELFHRMPKHLVDDWAIVCVLNACSHSGLRQEAELIFEKVAEEKRNNRICTVMVRQTGIDVFALLSCSSR